MYACNTHTLERIVDQWVQLNERVSSLKGEGISVGSVKLKFCPRHLPPLSDHNQSDSDGTVVKHRVDDIYLKSVHCLSRPTGATLVTGCIGIPSLHSPSV
jgi:hypothetical protein